VGYGTHLTVYWACSIKADHVENYGQKGGQARNEMNLGQVRFDPQLRGGRRRNQREKATNPYRPSVGATPSEDIPLIVKVGEELPARSGRLRLGQVERRG
jgi:hypothetical protein